jgi:hypothetical protein
MNNFKITKPIRLIETFSGVGTQAMALRDLGVNFEYWATSEPDVCHGKNNTYIRYEANGNYNAYDPITGQYIVPEGTNPWPSQEYVNHMIWKKWHNEFIE